MTSESGLAAKSPSMWLVTQIYLTRRRWRVGCARQKRNHGRNDGRFCPGHRADVVTSGQADQQTQHTNQASWPRTRRKHNLWTRKKTVAHHFLMGIPLSWFWMTPAWTSVQRSRRGRLRLISFPNRVHMGRPARAISSNISDIRQLSWSSASKIRSCGIWTITETLHSNQNYRALQKDSKGGHRR